MPVTGAKRGCARSVGGMESETQGSVRPLLLLVPSVPSGSWGSLSPSTALLQERGAPDLAVWGWETWGAWGEETALALSEGPLSAGGGCFLRLN